MRRVLSCLLFTISAHAEDGTAFFEAKVLPILKQRCYECHSHESKIKGGLALDSKSGWQAGGDHGAAITPGNVSKSLLVEAVRYTNPDMEMPPKGKLTASEIEVLEKWVAIGAPDPRSGAVSKASSIDIEAGKQFWAFQAVRDSQPPSVKNTNWPVNDVDRFILAKQESSGLTPAPDAEAHTWLRRVHLDLTGLPPTLEEISSFVTRHSSFESVVDKLLASPAFGERWARHWLDLTGYADQIGTSNNVFAEHAWRYRDYVIRAFNSDKPFDQFIREQIAGDLIAPTAESITATGFLVLGDVEIVAVDKLKMEHDLVDQQVSKIGTAFLGMTLGCVRCHDHKFDPIAQNDYYALAGMFRSTSSTYKTDNGVWSSVHKADLPETVAQRAAREKQLTHHESRLKALEAELKAKTAEKADTKALKAQIEHAKFFAPNTPKAFAVHDVEKPADMRITIRGNPYALGESVKRGTLRVASWADFPPIPPNQSGRVQLAEWLTDPRNPLTARVTVNRIWQKLFGEGLVRTVDYFGTRGEKPTHPELLDHLAVQFMKHGWSQKRLIRELVLSRTYRQRSEASGSSPYALRPQPFRLDAEAIRDAMLAISGRLVPSSGGTALPLEFPENVQSLSPGAVNPPAFSFKKTRPIQEFERTIYQPVIRTAAQPGSARLRDVFDFTQPAQIAGKRAETAVPTQSLFLINSDLVRARANDIAKLVTQAEPNPGARLEALWLRVLSRPITSTERDEANAFLDSLPADKAWIELTHALLASNEFLLRL
ncbi:MAG: DUF1549 domain-containing protein [Verrucomicrobiaceae bacterium]|nr:DUF1549 domain-containing protein [Verrucomicrobiaceae bacterium]